MRYSHFLSKKSTPSPFFFTRPPHQTYTSPTGLGVSESYWWEIWKGSPDLSSHYGGGIRAPQRGSGHAAMVWRLWISQVVFFSAIQSFSLPWQWHDHLRGESRQSHSGNKIQCSPLVIIVPWQEPDLAPAKYLGYQWILNLYLKNKWMPTEMSPPWRILPNPSSDRDSPVILCHLHWDLEEDVNATFLHTSNSAWEKNSSSALQRMKLRTFLPSARIWLPDIYSLEEKGSQKPAFYQNI